VIRDLSVKKISPVGDVSNFFIKMFRPVVPLASMVYSNKLVLCPQLTIRMHMSMPYIELMGRVEEVLIAPHFDTMRSTPVSKIQLILGQGIRGDRHAGVRLADVREHEYLSFGLLKGGEIANHRQCSLVSVEDLASIGKAMQLPAPIPYGCLGENLVVSGIPKFSELPIGTMLFFRKNEYHLRTAVLFVWSENTPCQSPGEMIQESFATLPNLARAFPRFALGKRGLVGGIYASGVIAKGDSVIAKIPKQRLYV
jgi:hypothetical protein